MEEMKMAEKQVAETILAQLGGKQFIAMTGAHNMLGSADSLTFKIMRNAKMVSHVRITLQPSDLYQVEFLKVRGGKVQTLASHDGIYFDGLCSLFERETGLYTRL
jgi:hypothetical protein